MLRLIVAFLLAVSFLPVRAADLAGHRARYQLILDPQPGSAVESAEGTMAFEVLDACEGWTIRQRLLLKMTARDGQTNELLSEYATYESKDGLTLRYRLRQIQQGAVASEIAGEATLERRGGPGSARYNLPLDDTIALPPGTVFPMAHTQAAIEAARRGERILAVPLFDGTNDDGVQDSTTTILSTAAPGTVSRFPALSALASWRMNVAFFAVNGGTGAPEYEVSLRYWENGVADELRMNFGDFSVLGRMEEFELIAPRC